MDLALSHSMIRVQCLKSSRFPISIENVGEEWLKFRKKTSLFWVGKLLTCPKFFPSCLWSTVLVQSNAFCVLFRWAIELSNFVDISDIAAYKVCSWSIFRRLGIFKVSKIVLHTCKFCNGFEIDAWGWPNSKSYYPWNLLVTKYATHILHAKRKVRVQ